MPPTHKTGRNASLKLIRAGTTMNMSSGLDDSALARAVDTHEVTSYGDNDKFHLPGHRSATISGSGPWASTYETFLSGCLGTTGVTFRYAPLSTETGNPLWTGSLLVTSYDVQLPAAGRVSYSIDTIITGAVTSTKEA